MDFTFSYAHSLLLAAGALTLLLLGFSLRRRWTRRPTRLRQLLSKKSRDPAYTEFLVPLLVFEERYPSFSAILGLVLERFPLASFMRDKEFRSALTFLSEAAFRDVNEESLRTAMCELVRHLLQNPDVEYECRAELSTLVERFLYEVVEGNLEKG